MFNSHGKHLNPARTLVLGFFAIILTGAFLLSLPAASRGGDSVSFLTALFTATSAICVTGLVVVDTALTWSVFGQAVILVLMQIGGLGFMSVITVFFFVMNKKIGLTQRLLLVKTMNLHDIQGIIKLIRHIIIGTFIFEGIGAVILWVHFLPYYGAWKSLGMGVFHSVSAFCNAGFDLLGGVKPLSSFTSIPNETVVLITVMLLSFIGGIGFFVWEDIWNQRNIKKLHLHTKMVLAVSFWLILIGWILFYFAERTNAATIGNMLFGEGVLVSLFQTVTPRSGGFSVINQSELTGVSSMVTMMLMLIGGSAGSTAGGIKNVTAGILILSAINSLRGKNRLTVFGRTIPQAQTVSALSIAVLAITACVIGSSAIAFIQPELPFLSVVFETVSAVATCGLSRGITPDLAPASQIIIIISMFLGRIGIMTFGMAAFINRGKTEKIKYPDTWVMMG